MSITLAVEQIPPDVIGAIVARLRSVTNLLTLCPDEMQGTRKVKRISGSLQAVPGQDGWQGHAIVVQPAGGSGADLSAPFDTPRVDCLCYGATGYEANRAARLVVAALEPVARYGYGFVQGDCAITDVHHIAGPLAIYDRQNKAHVRAVTFEVRYCLVPVEVAS